MSADTKVVSLMKEVATLDKKLSVLNKKQADLVYKQAQALKAMHAANSASALPSKARDYERYTKELSRVQDDFATVTKRRADKDAELSRARDTQQKEREKDLRRVAELEEKQRRERMNKERAFNQEMEALRIGMRQEQPSSTNAKHPPLPQHDFFISHASEDKEEVARPLYDALTIVGCRVWYDEFSLKIGDSLRRNIERGISGSRFGIVILSENFFKKEWPARELDTLTAIEISGDKKVLPIWHRVSKDFILSKAPLLADKLALNTAVNTIPEIARKLKELLD
jgi:hypothetical protein